MLHDDFTHASTCQNAVLQNACPLTSHLHVFSTQFCSVHVMQLLRTAEGMPLSDKPLWQRSDLDAGQLVNEFQRECHVVRRSIDGDLVKVPFTFHQCSDTLNSWVAASVRKA